MESIDARKKAAIEEREKLSAELTELQERQKELEFIRINRRKKRSTWICVQNGTETADFKRSGKLF